MKKTLAMILALMLVFGLASVSYAFAPSRTVSDIVTVQVVAEAPARTEATATRATGTRRTTSIPDFGVPLSGLGFAPIADAPWVSDVLTKLQEFLSTEGAALLDFFGDDAKGDILSLLPPGVDPDTLQLDELVAMEILDYADGVGDVKVAMDFPTTYREGQVVVPVVGVYVDDETTNWNALEGEIDSQNKLSAVFPQELLKEIYQSNRPFAFSVLSAP